MSIIGFPSKGPLSSLVMRRKNLEEHLVSSGELLIAIETEPFSHQIAISSGDKRLTGGGGSFVDEGNRVKDGGERR